MKTVGRGLAVTAFTVGASYGQFVFEKEEDALVLSEAGTPVLAFNHGEIEPPETGTARSGYVHPLYGIDGDPLTDDFPSDHVHHRGVFFGWPRMTVMGDGVDVWHLRGLRPRFHEFLEIREDGSGVEFEARNLWHLESSEGAAVEERLHYRIHPADEVGREIDIRAEFTNLTEEPVVLRGQVGRGYGGLNVRMDGQRPDVVITTANGVLDGDADSVEPASPWADHSSRAGAGEPHSGVAIFQHPANPGFPVRSWTLRYYGFLGAAWPGEENHEIAPGESVVLRYRLFVHRGTAEEAGVAARFERFVVEREKREEGED